VSTIDPQQAASTQVVATVYSPVFFQKLAAVHNIVPQDKAEADMMLTMAAQLRMAYDMKQQKTAAAHESPLVRAQRNLNARLEQVGLHQKQAAYSAAEIRRSAIAASYDPTLAANVLRMAIPAQPTNAA